MSNPNKRKGTAFESAVVKYLNARWEGRAGLRAYRPAQAGRDDIGDINGVSPFVIQCKDWRALVDALREGVEGAEKQRLAAGEEYGIAAVKRARKPVADAYAVMRLETFADVLLRLRQAEQRPD